MEKTFVFKEYKDGIVEIDDSGSFNNLDKKRLVSSGGRPTDTKWDMKRLVPFRSSVWKKLNKIAKEMSNERKVSPAQLAAHMIEQVMEQR